MVRWTPANSGSSRARGFSRRVCSRLDRGLRLPVLFGGGVMGSATHGGALACGGSCILASSVALQETYEPDSRTSAEIVQIPRIPSTVEGVDFIRVIRAALHAATPGMTHHARCCALAARFGDSPDTMDRLLQGRVSRVRAEHVTGALAIARASGVDTLAIPGVREVIKAITGVSL